VATPNFIRETNLTYYFELVNRDGKVLIDAVSRDPRLVLHAVVPPPRIYPVGASAHLRVFERTS
jgi:hypothetical protein